MFKYLELWDTQLGLFTFADTYTKQVYTKKIVQIKYLLFK